MKNHLKTATQRVLLILGLSLAINPTLQAGIMDIIAPMPKEADVIIHVYQTDEGKRRPMPTAQNPAYCYMVSSGFQELGYAIPGMDRTPPIQEVEKEIRKALAVNHFQAVTRQSPRVDIVLSYSWGYQISPWGFFAKEDPIGLDRNSRRNMMLLMGGKNFIELPTWEQEELRRQMDEDRFFVFIFAYDASAILKKEKKALWVAIMSMDAHRKDMTDCLKPMLTSAAPLLGTDNEKPVVIEAKIGKQSDIRVGPLKVIEEDSKEYLPTHVIDPKAETKTPTKPKSTPPAKNKKKQ